MTAGRIAIYLNENKTFLGKYESHGGNGIRDENGGMSVIIYLFIYCKIYIMHCVKYEIHVKLRI